MCECLLCGRKLKAKKSIEREEGPYGPTCYRIYKNMQKVQKNDINSEILKNIQEENKFLKMEITRIQMQLRTIKTNPGNFRSTEDPIERIKREEKRPEQKLNEGSMIAVMGELKSIFDSMDNIRSILEKPTEFSTLNPPKDIYSNTPKDMYS
jgi:hypothetical protein